MDLSPANASILTEQGGPALQWAALREHIAAAAQTPTGRVHILALEPSADRDWIAAQQTRTAEMRLLVAAGTSFAFRGIADIADLLAQAGVEGVALAADELLAIVLHAERIAAWRALLLAPPDSIQGKWPAIGALSASVVAYDLEPMLRNLRGKIEPDGTLADSASPELSRIRRELARQHRAIEDTLRRALTRLTEEGSAQESLISIRGERFVIPVKSEARRRVQGVVHGTSSTGQTLFIEPLETIEANNDLVRLLDDEQAEVHRILATMTRSVASNGPALQQGGDVLAQLDAHQAIAAFAQTLHCVRPLFDGTFSLLQARHPLLELHLRAQGIAVVPLDIALPAPTENESPTENKSPTEDESPTETAPRQMILSGPNTGGKTVTLRTVGLLALMAQAGMPVPAATASLPIFRSIYADIGDAQSIEQNLSTFSAHLLNIDRISRLADPDSLVLLDELGSATDPEEGAALAVAVAKHFLTRRAWCFITTHLTALKVYAAGQTGVFNAAVGFNEETLSPTYTLRLGVPGASAGLNIAERLGLDSAIIADARAQRTTQQRDIAHFLDQLHTQLTNIALEREQIAEQTSRLQRERLLLEQEGRKAQQARVKEMRRELETLLEDFEAELRKAVKAIDDKTVARKMQREAAVRVAGMKREFSERFATTVAAHTPQAHTSPAKPSTPLQPSPGDLVTLKSLRREGRVLRVLDAKTLEVAVGPMKMRVDLSDIASITPSPDTPSRHTSSDRRRGGSVSVSVQTTGDDTLRAEINVIGRTADEAEQEVERFLDQAFLAGLPRIRIVHGVGMGVLRRTLRELLRNHPHVVSIAEPPYNEGGQGATLVELRQ